MDGLYLQQNPKPVGRHFNPMQIGLYKAIHYRVAFFY